MVIKLSKEKRTTERLIEEYGENRSELNRRLNLLKKAAPHKAKKQSKTGLILLVLLIISMICILCFMLGSALKPKEVVTINQQTINPVEITVVNPVEIIEKEVTHVINATHEMTCLRIEGSKESRCYDI